MDEPTSGTSGIDRRTLLSSLASASGIGVGFASATGDGRGAESETTIRQLTGEERERTLREAFDDDRTEEVLASNLPADAEMTDARVVRSSYAGTDWRVVSAAFESESGTEVTVFWSDHEETDPTATVAEPGSDAGAELRAVETPGVESVPIAFNPCKWGNMPDPDCIVETGYLYAEEIAACARCASNARDLIDVKSLSKKKLLVKIARVAPSCVICLYESIQKYSEHGIPCELCVPEEEVGLEDGDSVSM